MAAFFCSTILKDLLFNIYPLFNKLSFLPKQQHPHPTINPLTQPITNE